MFKILYRSIYVKKCHPPYVSLQPLLAEDKSELRLSELTGCDLPERLARDGRLLVSWVGREAPKTTGLDRTWKMVEVWEVFL